MKIRERKGSTREGREGKGKEGDRTEKETSEKRRIKVTAKDDAERNAMRE